MTKVSDYSYMNREVRSLVVFVICEYKCLVSMKRELKYQNCSCTATLFNRKLQREFFFRHYQPKSVANVISHGLCRC